MAVPQPKRGCVFVAVTDGRLTMIRDLRVRESRKGMFVVLRFQSGKSRRVYLSVLDVPLNFGGASVVYHCVSRLP